MTPGRRRGEEGRVGFGPYLGDPRRELAGEEAQERGGRAQFRTRCRPQAESEHG